ncbi:unnamed protein product [Tuber melanosporum]|uniref:(Perigord truffle) hypothetical protein n=1 Tax=Tuber melanosporum (strain Mel28) TaxID=656061 RepID=D5G7W8_TUBMM|nr:uncharacterized protein GSTUM_00002684001 [Tuber melanosporum]CAZ80611.1 unnamed protein product [Tuber melanosporum]
MNYTYLPVSPYPLPATSISSPSPTPGPIIIMTTQPSTKKTLNLTSNPRVSLLVHDWVSHRPSLSSANPFAPSASPPHQTQSASPLSTFLTNLNSAALSSISATLNGYAHLIPHGTEDEEYYKRVHLENNPQSENKCYLEGEEVRVVVVRIGWARVADFRGGVTDWTAEGEGGNDGGMGWGPGPGNGLANGLINGH